MHYGALDVICCILLLFVVVWAPITVYLQTIYYSRSIYREMSKQYIYLYPHLLVILQIKMFLDFPPVYPQRRCRSKRSAQRRADRQDSRLRARTQRQSGRHLQYDEQYQAPHKVARPGVSLRSDVHVQK